MRAWGLAAALAVLCACDGRLEEGRVDAQFSPAECPPGEPKEKLRDFGFDPNRLQTQRFGEVVILQILQHRAVQEEVDNLSVRIDMQPLLDQGLMEVRGDFYELTQSPIMVSLSSTTADLALNLYSTCPDRPNATSTDGQVTLQNFRIAVVDSDTGEQELITGSVSATVEMRARTTVTAQVQASFDFAPPRSSLITFE